MTSTVTDNVLRDAFGLPGRERLRDQPLHRPRSIVDAPTAARPRRSSTPVVSEAREGRPEDARHRGRDCRLALKDDLASASARGGTTSSTATAPSGVAVFASSAGRGVPRAAAARARGRRSCGSAASSAVAPLVGQLGPATAASSPSLSRERGTVYRVARRPARRDRRRDRGARRASTSQGGWSQARYQRHIEHLVQQHLKTVGQEIDKTGARGRRPAARRRRARGAAQRDRAALSPRGARGGRRLGDRRGARRRRPSCSRSCGRCSTRRVPVTSRRRSSAGRRSTAVAGAPPRAGSRRSTPPRTGASQVLLVDESSARPRGVGVPAVRSRLRRRRQVRARRHEARADAGRAPSSRSTARSQHGGSVVRLGAGALGEPRHRRDPAL